MVYNILLPSALDIYHLSVSIGKFSKLSAPPVVSVQAYGGEKGREESEKLQLMGGAWKPNTCEQFVIGTASKIGLLSRLLICFENATSDDSLLVTEVIL